jgi:hypothetical protein
MTREVFISKIDKMTLDKISFTDCPVETLNIDRSEKLIKVSFSESYDLTENKYLGKMNLIIEKYSSLKMIKFPPNKDGTFGEVELENTTETFEIIQEVSSSDSKIELKGFSKESGNWMIYEISNAQVHIQKV